MNKLKKITTATLMFITLTIGNAFSEEIRLNIIKKSIPDHEENIKKIRKTLLSADKSNVDGLKKITITPIENSEVYMIKEGSKRTFLSDKTGEYIISGQILRFKNGKMDVIKNVDNPLIMEKLNIFNESNLVTYNPEGDIKNKIFVFVDYTCPFCKKFHENTLENLVKNGIQVIYLPFPRNSRKNIIEGLTGIFCLSSNELRKAAMTEAYNKGSEFISKNFKECNKKEYYLQIMRTGMDFKLNGTPAVFNSDGKYLGGYKGYLEFMEILK
jgi:thiol:disulfide interchange protein DsbC